MKKVYFPASPMAAKFAEAFDKKYPGRANASPIVLAFELRKEFFGADPYDLCAAALILSELGKVDALFESPLEAALMVSKIATDELMRKLASDRHR